MVSAIKKLSSAFIVITFLIISITNSMAENWPNWRGPRNDGTSNETRLPAKWSKSENVKWRLELPGPAPSTPVVWNDRIFLTSAEWDSLALLCVNTSGKVLWKRTVGSGNKDIREGESNAASPSPSTDGKYVWVFFGTGILACFDFEGNEVWRSNLQKRYGGFSMYWGMSTTPLLDGDKLYLQLLHSNEQLVLALDKMTGREIWKHHRKTDAMTECLHSYASPFLYRFDGQEFLLTHGADYVVAHNLKDGSEIWRCGGLQKPNNYNHYLRFVASPVATPGLIVVPSAKNGPVLGLNPKNARGDITHSKTDYAWKRKDNTPDVPSPLIHDGLVYLCRENGVLICIDARTGEEIYQERAYSKRHRGSPVYADGKIYLMAADGTVTVVKAGREFEIISKNSVGERMAASLAISDGTIYLRSHKALYAIADK